jgi:hypothetical protein
MRDFSSSRGSYGKQGLSFEKPTHVEQGGDGDARSGFVTHETASIGIEHPGRDSQDRAILELNEVTVFGHAPKPPHDVAFAIGKGMMPITNAHRQR